MLSSLLSVVLSILPLAVSILLDRPKRGKSRFWTVGGFGREFWPVERRRVALRATAATAWARNGRYGPIADGSPIVAQPRVGRAGMPVEEIQARQAVERAPILADLASGRLTVHTVRWTGATAPPGRYSWTGQGSHRRLRLYQAGRTYLQVIAAGGTMAGVCSRSMPPEDELEALVRLHQWRADLVWRGRSLGVTL